ncbi:hypothetical protein BDV12DRAFT_205127 [Aspergillus spectabilis]
MPLIGTILWAVLYQAEQKIPEPLKIPPAQIKDSFNLETASVIVVVTDDITLMTVTQPPEQDQATGPPRLLQRLQVPRMEPMQETWKFSWIP